MLIVCVIEQLIVFKANKDTIWCIVVLTSRTHILHYSGPKWKLAIFCGLQLLFGLISPCGEDFVFAASLQN